MLILLDKLKYIPDSTALYSCKFDLVFYFVYLAIMDFISKTTI